MVLFIALMAGLGTFILAVVAGFRIVRGLERIDQEKPA